VVVKTELSGTNAVESGTNAVEMLGQLAPGEVGSSGAAVGWFGQLVMKHE
jgi:hypothetical protein